MSDVPQDTALGSVHIISLWRITLIENYERRRHRRAVSPSSSKGMTTVGQKSPSVQPQSQQQLIVSPETMLSMQRRSREAKRVLLCPTVMHTHRDHHPCLGENQKNKTR